MDASIGQAMGRRMLVDFMLYVFTGIGVEENANVCEIKTCNQEKISRKISFKNRTRE